MPAHVVLVDLDAEAGTGRQRDPAAAAPDPLAQEVGLDVLRPVQLQRVDVERGGELQARGEAEVGLGQPRQRKLQAGLGAASQSWRERYSPALRCTFATATPIASARTYSSRSGTERSDSSMPIGTGLAPAAAGSPTG